MFRGIYRHIWTENITTTVVWWLCCQSVELIVTSLTPESEVSGGRGDAQEPVGGWMMVHLKSQGTPRQDSVDFSGLLRHVICLREKKKIFWYSTAACYLRHRQVFLFMLKPLAPTLRTLAFLFCLLLCV